MVDDLGVTQGAMVASVGFTVTAVKRAKEAGVDTYQLLDVQNPPVGRLLSVPFAVRELILGLYSFTIDL